MKNHNVNQSGPHLLSKEQVGEFLGVSTSMVNKLLVADEHRIPSYKIGSRRLVKLAELEQWLEEQAA